MNRAKQQLVSQHFSQDKAKCAYPEVARDYLVHAHVEVVTYGPCRFAISLSAMHVLDASSVSLKDTTTFFTYDCGTIRCS